MTRRVVRVLTFEGCPHAEAAAAAARDAILEYGQGLDLVEVDLEDPKTPAEYKAYPSPTILVGSTDVSAGTGPVDGVGCRASGAPSVEEVRLAIRAVWGPSPSG